MMCLIARVVCFVTTVCRCVVERRLARFKCSPSQTTVSHTINTMSTPTSAQISQVTGKVVTSTLVGWKNKFLSDLHVIFSIGVDVRDEASTQLAKLGVVDPATLVSVTTAGLTRLLTDFATQIDPTLPQCMQTLFISAIPLIVKEIVVCESAIVQELESSGLCCFSSNATTPPATVTTTVTPVSQLNYIPSCDATPSPSATAATTTISVPSSPVTVTQPVVLSSGAPYIR
jgi:hypothetical protein